MQPNHLVSAALALLVSSSAVAQITVRVEALSPSGVSLIDENGVLQSMPIPVGAPFTQQEVYPVSTHGTGSQWFIDYTETEVTPPLSVVASAQNRVTFETRLIAKTGTMVPSLFTTGGNPAQPGTQKFRVTITSAHPRRHRCSSRSARRPTSFRSSACRCR